MENVPGKKAILLIEWSPLNPRNEMLKMPYLEDHFEHQEKISENH